MKKVPLDEDSLRPEELELPVEFLAKVRSAGLGGTRLVGTDVKKRGLGGCVLVQLEHVICRAFGLFLLALVFALSFVFLFLLPRLFFLTLAES